MMHLLYLMSYFLQIVNKLQICIVILMPHNARNVLQDIFYEMGYVKRYR